MTSSRNICDLILKKRGEAYFSFIINMILFIDISIQCDFILHNLIMQHFRNITKENGSLYYNTCIIVWRPFC
jgi:hypothetical protein